MMKFQRFSLVLLLTISANALRADATDDLLFAVESGDMNQVKKAVDCGADLDISREEDGHNARSLAMAKVIESLEQNQDFAKWAAIASMGIPVAALINSWQYTLAATATAFLGFKLQTSSSKGFLEKLRNYGIGKYIVGASALAATGVALSSTSPYTLAPAAVGTAGLLALILKSREMHGRLEIYSLLNPEDEIMEEAAEQTE